MAAAAPAPARNVLRSMEMIVPVQDCGLNATPYLSQNLLHHVTAHSREPGVHAGVEVCQPGVIEAHQVKYGGVKIGNVTEVLDGRESEFVSRADGLAAFHSRAGEPHGEAVPVVV